LLVPILNNINKRNKKIFKELAELMKLSSESTFFTKLMNEVYQPHLKDYVRYVQRERERERSLFCQLYCSVFIFQFRKNKLTKQI
jgi:hypothetical protein